MRREHQSEAVFLANLERRVRNLELRRRPSGLSVAVDTLDEFANGFTNSVYASLDNLLTSSFSRDVEVTAATGAEALVILSCAHMSSSTGTVFLGYAVSGATITASSDNDSARNAVSGSNIATTYVSYLDDLTLGDNTFTLSARTTSGSGQLRRPSIAVIPL